PWLRPLRRGVPEGRRGLADLGDEPHSAAGRPTVGGAWRAIGTWWPAPARRSGARSADRRYAGRRLGVAGIFVEEDPAYTGVEPVRALVHRPRHADGLDGHGDMPNRYMRSVDGGCPTVPGDRVGLGDHRQVEGRSETTVGHLAGARSAGILLDDEFAVVFDDLQLGEVAVEEMDEALQLCADRPSGMLRHGPRHALSAAVPERPFQLVGAAILVDPPQQRRDPVAVQVDRAPPTSQPLV